MKASLRAKLIGFILLLAALIAVALTTVGYLQTRSELINNSIRNEMLATAKGTNQLIKAWINTRKAIVTAGVQTLEASDNPQLAIVQTAKSGNFQAAYLGTPDKQMIADHDMQLPAGYDPTIRPWYKDNVGASGTVMTAPYIDMSTKKLVISFVSPAKKNGAFIGVMGTDVLLDDIVANVLGLKLVGDGYAFLIGKDGKVLVHSAADRVTKPATEIAADFSPSRLEDMSKSGAVQTVRIDDADKFIHVEAIEGADLYLVIAVDRTKALAPLNTLIWQAALTLVVLLLIVVPLGAFLINRLLASLRRMHDIMIEIAGGGGDLTHAIDINGQDEVAETAQAFNRFLEQLRVMFQKLQNESHHLTEGVNQMHDIVGQLSEDSRDLSDLTQQNASAIEEITVSIAHIADNSHDADQLIKDTGSLSQDSSAAVREVAQEVVKSSHEVQGLSDLLDRLNQRSDEISGIIRVIKDIADQTNLLALNAAIEAARAGEQGRGFAVVADEVRKLAERTGQATVQITQMIEGISNETHDAVANMHETLVAVRRSADSSNSAADKIGTISVNMDAVVQKMEDIAISTKEQLAATTAMAQAAERITERTQSSDTALQSAAEEIRYLNELAQNLRKLFANFHV